jgi:AcrR family transcriptional regulator
MVRLFGKRVGRARRESKGRRDEKRSRLYRVGAALLAGADYEDVSIARLTREAGISVGAFYGRFAHKDNFIELLIAATFRRLVEQTEAELSHAQWDGKTRGEVIQGVMHHIVQQIGDDRNAGILRAAVKLGTREPAAWREIQTYREKVAECAVKLMESLSDRSSPHTVRTVIQIALATVIDAALLDSRPLRFASGPMVSELSEVVARYLGVSGKHEWDKVTIDRGRLPGVEKGKVVSEAISKEALRELPAPTRKGRRPAIRKI